MELVELVELVETEQSGKIRQESSHSRLAVKSGDTEARSNLKL